MRIGKSYEQFLREIEAFLLTGRTGPSLLASLALDSASWEEKLAEMSRLIAQVRPLGETEGGRPFLSTGLESSWA